MQQFLILVEKYKLELKCYSSKYPLEWLNEKIKH